MAGASDKDKAVFRKLRAADPECLKCFDCGEPEPQWAAVHHAVLLCSDCAGAHRGLGVHISFVRSTTMDAWESWKPAALRRMRKGGNARCRSYFRRNGVPLRRKSESAAESRAAIPARYTHAAAQCYRAMLDAELAGKPFDEDSFVPPVPPVAPPQRRRARRAEKRPSAPAAAPASFREGESVVISEAEGLGIGSVAAVNATQPPSYIVRFADGTRRGAREAALRRPTADDARRAEELHSGGDSAFGGVQGFGLPAGDWLAALDLQGTQAAAAGALGSAAEAAGALAARLSGAVGTFGGGGGAQQGGDSGGYDQLDGPPPAARPEARPAAPHPAELAAGAQERTRSYVVPLGGQLGLNYRELGPGNVLVDSLVPGGAAEAAGVPEGERLLSVHACSVARGRDVPAAVAAARREGAQEVVVVTTAPPDSSGGEELESSDSGAALDCWVVQPPPGSAAVPWRYTELLSDTVPASELPPQPRGARVLGRCIGHFVRADNGLFLPGSCLRPDGAAPPRRLRLRCGGGWAGLAGRYRLRREGVRGMPCWRRSGGGGWLYSGPRGAWLVAESAEHLADGLGWISSDGAHQGVLPHRVRSWKSYDEAVRTWRPDPGVRFLLRRPAPPRPRGGRAAPSGAAAAGLGGYSPAPAAQRAGSPPRGARQRRGRGRLGGGGDDWLLDLGPARAGGSPPPAAPARGGADLLDALFEHGPAPPPAPPAASSSSGSPSGSRGAGSSSSRSRSRGSSSSSSSSTTDRGASGSSCGRSGRRGGGGRGSESGDSGCRDRGYRA